LDHWPHHQITNWRRARLARGPSTTWSRSAAAGCWTPRVYWRRRLAGPPKASARRWRAPGTPPRTPALWFGVIGGGPSGGRSLSACSCLAESSSRLREPRGPLFARCGRLRSRPSPASPRRSSRRGSCGHRPPRNPKNKEGDEPAPCGVRPARMVDPPPASLPRRMELAHAPPEETVRILHVLLYLPGYNAGAPPASFGCSRRASTVPCPWARTSKWTGRSSWRARRGTGRDATRLGGSGFFTRSPTDFGVLPPVPCAECALWST
jgi:hypothetical protein